MIKNIKFKGTFKNLMFILSTIVGVMLAFVMVYIAWQHNPQCEFYCKDEIFFAPLLIIGAFWFILGFLVVLLILLTYRIFHR